MSPPHTPPPLPPELLEKSVEIATAAETEERTRASENSSSSSIKDDAASRISDKDELDDLGQTCLRCGLTLPYSDAGE